MLDSKSARSSIVRHLLLSAAFALDRVKALAPFHPE